MEAMCDWCGQVVPVGLDGTCFLGHPVSAAPVPAAGPGPVDLDIAAEPSHPADTVAPVPDFAAVGSPLPPPPAPADLGPVPPLLPPQPPIFSGAPSALAAPAPPHAPIVPPPMPVPPLAAAPAPAPQPVGALATTAAMPVQNPVDAAFAPLINATAPHDPAVAQQMQPALALPPQAPTGPGWQAVHIADDVAVFEYRRPDAAAGPAGVVSQLPPSVAPPLPPAPYPAVVPAPIGADALGTPVADSDVAQFAPGDELDIPDSGSKVRVIVMLAILVVVALGAALAFAFGLI